MKLPNILAVLVLAIGSTQMVGYLTDSRILRGIGLASGVAPFPKVFCEADGYEAFAARFHLEGTRPDGSRWTCPLDPERYAQIKGPYNRRNVHGATLAFAPRLPDELRSSLISQALSPDSDLRRELDIPSDLTDLRVIITPRHDEPHGPWSCNTHGELTEIP